MPVVPNSDKTQMRERHDTRSSVAKLVEVLALAPRLVDDQDWALTAASPDSLEELVALYVNERLNDDDRFALMGLIIASADDALTRGPLAGGVVDTLITLAVRDIDLHRDRFEYWARFDVDNVSEAFAVSPLVRVILDQA